MTTTYRNTEITIEIIHTPHGDLCMATAPKPTKNAWPTLDEAADEQKRLIDKELAPATIPELCYLLDPSQQAEIYAMLSKNCEEAENDTPYHRIMLQIEEEMYSNCGVEDTQRYIERALA